MLRRIALATGVIDKAGAIAYERLIRPPAHRWPLWIERCFAQATGGLEALAAEPWSASDRLDQAEITTACMLRYLQIAVPDLLPAGRCPSLQALSARCEALPEFRATCPADYAVPRSD